MRTFYLKNFRNALIFCISFALSTPAFCVDLYVSGATNPTSANGRYIPNGTYSGYNCWVHESGGYYIYNDTYSTSGRYWNLDTDFIDEGTAPTVVFYSSTTSTAASPASVSSWSPDTGFSGTLTVTEGAPVPEIDIQGNGVSITSGGTTISSSNYTNLGSANVSGETIVRTYTIKNVGGATLTLSGSTPYVTIGGTNSANFSVSGIPSASIAPNSSTTFQITFDPSAAGNRNASISIGNNDSNENPYTFAIQGYGFTPGNLAVSSITSPSAANGTYIHQGTINSFQYWKHQTQNYYIFNDVYSGTSYWNIDADTNDDNTNYLFYKASESGSPQGLSGWTANTAAPVPTGNPVINDANPTPDISLAGNYVDIINNDATPSFKDNTNFGSLNIASGTRTRVFKIHSTGSAILTLSGTSPYITIGGAAASDFSITTNPSASISAGDSTSFVVTFDPVTEGTRTATLSIASNDPDENPFTFTIQGDGFITKNLIVSGINTPAVINGKYVHQGILNEFQYWKHESLNYYIYNHKYSTGTTFYWNIDNDTDDTKSYYFSRDHFEDASPVNVMVWDTTGTKMGAIGTPLVVYATPEMDVKGNGASIADNDLTPSASDDTDFGSVVATSGTISHTFTIYNTGHAVLNLTGTPKVNISGTNASEFVVTTQPNSPVAVSSGSTTFTVKFDPGGLGTRSATISIANDDSDENPYTFTIQGTGVWQPLNNNALDFDGSNDYVSVPGIASQSFTEITVEMWVYRTLSGTDQKIIGDADGSSPRRGFCLAISDQNKLYPEIFNSGSVNVTSSDVIPLNQWTHIAFTWKKGDYSDGIKGYINGKQVISTSTVNTDMNTSNGLTIGSAPWFREKYFKGMIDEVRIWNVARTATEIREGMMRSVDGNSSGLIAYYLANEASGNTLYDATANSYNGALTNMDGTTDWVDSEAFTTWIGTTSSDWGTATNWSDGVPTSSDNVGLYKWGTNSEATVSGSPTVENLMISSTSSLALGSNLTVNGNLILEKNMDLNGKTVALGSNGTLFEDAGVFFGSTGSITTTRNLSNLTAQNVGGLGAVITTAANMGSTTIARAHGNQSWGGNNSILRYYDINPTTNSGLNATLTFNYLTSELNSLTETNLKLFKSSDGGSSYTFAGGTVSTDNNYITIASLNSFSRWMATESAPVTVTTQAVSSIGTITATGNGNITALGIPNPTAYGVCWNTTGSPTISDSKVDKGAASATGTFTADMAGLTPYQTYHVKAYANNTSGTSYGNEVTFTTLGVPEINIQGNSTDIADGSSSPSPANHTDFGSATIGIETVTRTFTVQNTGSAVLTLGSDAVTITGDSDFTITDQPDATVAVGGSTTFEVTFEAAAIGSRTAEISIANDDSNENPYTFAIQATGLPYNEPEWSVTGNYALKFDGVDDYVSVPDNTSLDFTQFTIELWVYRNSSSGCKLIGQNYPNDHIKGFILGIEGDKLQIEVWNSASTYTNLNSGTETIPLNKWTHLVMSWKAGDRLKGYINGKQVIDGATFNADITNTTPMIIGMAPWYNLNQGHFSGYLDEIRIWNTIRTQAEIKANMYHSIGSTTGLVANYKMSDGSGTTLTDNSNKGNNGTLRNGPAWIVSGAFSGPKQALGFDGSNDYISIPDHDSLDMGTGDFTYEFWVKKSGSNDVRYDIISKEDATNGNNDLSILINESNKAVIYTEGIKNNGSHSVTSNLTIPAGVWTHIAGVRYGTSLKVYINGVLDNTSIGTIQNISNSNVLILAANYNGIGNTGFLSGQLDEVRIWNVARTEAEIKETMTRNLAGDETGLVAYYRMDHNDGTVLYDHSKNGYNGSLANMDNTDWVVSSAFNYWLGTENTDWETAANWSNGVPVATDNVGLYKWNLGNEASVSDIPTTDHLLISSASAPALNSNITVNGNLLLEKNMGLNGQVVTIGPGGYLVEGNGIFSGATGSITTTRDLSNLTAQNVGGLGAVITTAANMGSTAITRGHANQEWGGHNSVLRYFDITPTNNTGLNATLGFNYYETELNSLAEANLKLFKSSDGGTSYTLAGGTTSAADNAITLSSLDGFSRWMAAESVSPTVTTQAISSITESTATGNGYITSLGAPNPTQHGHCWSTSQNPTIADSKTELGAVGTTGTFTSSLTGLTEATVYYVRAYVTNPSGTVYGEQVNFTTKNTISSIARTGSNPTNAALVNWAVTFDATVTGLTSSNFALENTGLTDPSITNVTGSGTTWTVTASTGSGSGSLGLSFTSNTGLNAGMSNTLPFAGEVYTIDKDTPTMSSSSPSDNATNATLSGDIVLTFDDNMTPGTSGFVTIKNLTDDTDFEQIPYNDSRISFSSTQVTINPGGTLLKGTGYYLEIDATALADDAGNQFAGITGNSSLNFTTVDVVINEVVSDPQTDWSTTAFDGADGNGAIDDGTDEWIELFVKSSGIDFSGWTIELLDGSDVTGDLTNTGAFDVSRYISSGSGIFTNSISGDYLVLGNVDGSGLMDDTGLTINLKDPGGAIVDAVVIGGAAGEAPTGLANDIYNESVQRFTNGMDTDQDDLNFTKGKATLGAANTGPGVTLSISDATISENAGTSTLTATLSAVCSQVVTVSIGANVSCTATGGGVDYTLASSIVITAGDITGTTILTAVQDTKDELNETVIIDITGVTNGIEAGIQQQTVTITDDDPAPTVAFNSTSSNGLESVSSANLQVDLSAVSGLVVTVDYTVTGTASGSGTDYTLADGTLTINAGDLTNNIIIASIIDDLLDEYDETVIVTLSNPTNATLGINTIHTYTINDNDPTPTVTFNSTNSNGLESVNSASLQVDLSAVSGLVVTVDYAVTGTATGSGTDYTLADGTLTINAGNPNNDIIIASIVDDLLDEYDETVIVTLSNPTNASLGTNTVHTYTITDNDAMPAVSFSSVSQSSTDETGTMTITAELSIISGRDVTLPFTINGSSTATGGGTDYSITASPITIAEGSTSEDITITITADDLDEPDETVIIDMGTPVNATIGTTSTHTATITDDDVIPTVTTTDANAITTSAATLGGNATSEGSASIIEKGVVYSSTDNTPIIGEAGVTKELNGSGTGIFSKSISGLSVNTRYYFDAFATNIVGTGYGTVSDFWTLANVPDAPAVDNPSATTLDITINPNGNPANTVFCIYEANTGKFVQTTGFLGLSKAWQNAADWATKTVTALSENTGYTFKVMASNGADVETDYSAETSVYTLAKIPSAPTVNNPTTSSLDVGVNANGNPAGTLFAIQETGGSKYVAADGTLGDNAVWQTEIQWETDASNTAKTVSGFSQNQEYTLKIKAKNGDDVETAFGGTSSLYTLANVPDAPTVDNPTATSLDVAVNENGNPSTTKFAIQDSINGTFVQANGTRAATEEWQTAVAWNTITVTGLSTGVTYYFRVKAKNADDVETAFGRSTGQNTCSNPTGGGIIGTNQTICSGTVPSVITNVELPSNYGGTPEYKWQFATEADSTSFSDIIHDSIGYAPGPLTGTTWYKRIVRVNCKTDWTGAAESNVVKISTHPKPVAFAGDDATIVEGEDYSLSDASAENYTSVSWTTAGDGSFSSTSLLTPVYTPGENDIAAGEVELCLHASPESPCTLDSTDCMALTILRHPAISISLPLDGSSVYSNPVTISGTATDADGDLSLVEIKLNGGNWESATGTDSWTVGFDLVPGKNTIQARVSDATNLYSDTAGINVLLSIQLISIPQGWSAISSFLTPLNPALPVMMDEITNNDNLVIMLSEYGIYWPPYNTNTIGNWNVEKGYKIKMNQAQEFTVRGDTLLSRSINLSQGYHIVPVLSNVACPIASIFTDPVNDILFMYDVKTSALYWPAGGIYTLSSLEPGKAYISSFKRAVTLTYPVYTGLKTGIINNFTEPPLDGPWPLVRTADVHFVSVKSEAVNKIENVSYIGAFDSFGSCIGYVEIDGRTGNYLLTLYGNDVSTDAKDGADEGEPISFSSYNSSTQTETELIAEYNTGFPNADGVYISGGQSEIINFKESSIGVGEIGKGVSVQIYPNPAKDVVNIVTQGFRSLGGIGTLTTTDGKMVKTFSITSQKTQLDISGLQPGIYMLKIELENQVVIKRVVIQ